MHLASVTLTGQQPSARWQHIKLPCMKAGRQLDDCDDGPSSLVPKLGVVALRQNSLCVVLFVLFTEKMSTMETQY